MNACVRVAILVTSSLTLFSCGPKGGGEQGGAFPPVAVKTAAVANQTIRTTSEYVAQLRSRHSVDVQPQVDGYVRRIAVRPGDRVSAGAVLMQIDPAKQTQSVRGLEAARNARVAALRLAEQQQLRAARLFKEGTIARQDLDQADAALASAKADVANFDAQISAETVQLRYYSITAPSAGIVGDIPVRVGDSVTSATRLTTIDQNSSLEAWVSIPIERASAAHAGLPVEILAEDDSVLAEGKIDFIAPRVTDATQSVEVKIPIANADSHLRASQFTRARVVWSARQSPVVPTTAITRLGGKPFIFVAEGGDKGLAAKQKPVELGELSGDVYEVLSGVKAGDRVIVSGIQKLRDGAPVAEETAAPAGK
jgi:RND family efflux transporter MFP subunit